MVGQRPLEPSILVRIQAPQHATVFLRDPFSFVSCRLRGLGTQTFQISEYFPGFTMNLKPIIAFIILVVIVVGGCWIYWHFVAPKEKVNTPEAKPTQEKEDEIIGAELLVKCEQTNSFLEKTKCFTDIFKEGVSEKLCERFYYNQDKEDCYLGAAIAKRNKELCREKSGVSGSVCESLVIAETEEGTPKEQLANCKNNFNCYSYIFREKQYNEALCGEIEQSDSCYYGAVIAKKDPALCDKIKNKNEKERCYLYIATIQKNESFCEKVSGMYGDICYSEVARAKKDTTLCEKIKSLDNLSMLEKKKEMCYGLVAIAKGDESLCGNIKIKPVKDDCYASIAIAKRDEKLCEKGGYKKDTCYRDIALIKLDQKLCEKAGGSKDICYFQIAKLKADEKLCEETGGKKNTCYLDIAIYKGDSTICEKFKGEDKDGCYYAVAISNGDENLCKKAGEAKNMCYIDVAVANKDETLCEKLEYDKDFCYYQLARTKRDERLCEKTGKFKEKCYKFLRK